MRRARRRIVLALGAVAAASTLATASTLVACGDDELFAAPDASSDAAFDVVPPRDADAGGDAAPPLPRGDRLLGLGLDLADPAFYKNLQLARDAGGVQATSLAFGWDEIERPYDAGAPSDAGDAEAGPPTVLFDPALHVANLLVSSDGTRLTLAIDAVDVGGSRAPADLSGRPLDDDALGARYERLEDYVLSQMHDTDLTALFVATDVDVPFGGDPVPYAALAKLVARASAHAKAVRPGLAVGFVVTADGAVARRDLLAAAWAASDVVGVSYLPLDAAGMVRPPDAVGADLDRVVAAAPAGARLVVPSLAYPSAAACGSSEGAQAAFVAAAFGAWDAHASRIAEITFVSLDDAPPDVAAATAARWGRSDAPFVAALGSLGYRAAGGRAKPSLAAFFAAARARGF